MKNFIFAGTFLLLMTVAVNHGQERQMDCSNAYAMALEVDALYNDFLMARSEVDMQANLRAVQRMQTGIEELLTTCENAGNVAEEVEIPVTAAHFGSGTPDDPYGYNQAAPAAEHLDLRVVEMRRPADDWLDEAVRNLFTPAEEGQEYVAISVEALCAFESRADCEVDRTAFRLIGDLGTEYAPADFRFEGEMRLRVQPSRSRIGVVAFLIDSQDTNLMLLYSPDDFASEDDWVYYRAQAAIEVVATAQLIVRGGPGTQFAPQAGLVQGQIAHAIGRNDDASWLRIPDGWVYAEYLHLREGDALLLPVVEE